MDSNEYMLTTIDNPYNPFTEYSKWDSWDQTAGYHTSAYLGRVVLTVDEMSDFVQSLAIKEAIDEIVRENVLGLYTTITEDGTKSSIVPAPSIQPDTPMPQRSTSN